MKLKLLFTAALSAFCVLLNLKPANAQSHNSLLWQISGKGMAHPAYLFGTVHMYDTSAYRLPQAAFDKINQVQQVYFELDFGKINPAEMMQSIFVKDSTQTLDKLLDASVLAKLKAIAQQTPTLKMMGNNLYRLKPFFVSAFLMTTPQTTSVDMEMYKAAKSHNDQVGGLETVQEQMAAIDAVPLKAQAQMLAASLNKFTSAQEMINQMTATYAGQDIDHLLQQMNDDMPLDDNFNASLLHKRNIVMDNRIEAMLGKQPMLIAVGAGHLGGTDGLLALLKQHGYTLKSLPVTFNKAH